MSVLEMDPDPERDHANAGDEPELWPEPELLFPPRRVEREEAAPGALRPSAPEPSPTSILPVQRVASPPRRRSVARGAAAMLQLLVLVLFTAALVAALAAGVLLLLTMALRAAVT